MSSSSGTQHVIGTGSHNFQRNFVHGDSTPTITSPPPVTPPPLSPGESCWSIFLMEANDDLGRSLETSRLGYRKFAVSLGILHSYSYFVWLDSTADKHTELALCLQSPCCQPDICLFLFMLETKKKTTTTREKKKCSVVFLFVFSFYFLRYN